MSSISILSVATAKPPYQFDQPFAKEFMMRHYGEKLSPRNAEVMEKVFSHPSIKQRHLAIDTPETLLNEDPDSRTDRFTRWSIELSTEAITKALAHADVPLAAVTGLVVNTCTGYLCPGVSTYLIERLGLSRQIRAYDLVGSGCGGVIPNLQVAASLARDLDEGVVVSVASEICSATYQMEDNLSLILSNALFSDGAAAVVLGKKRGALQLIDSESVFIPEHRDAIRYIHRRGELFNQLSCFLPQLIKKAAARVVETLLSRRSLHAGAIKHWAFHAGGEKIIAAIQSEIGLSDEQLLPTRTVLERHGNMSSPTVLFVLKEILERGMAEGDWCLMGAFGAGLSAHGYLLRKLKQ